MRGGDGDAGGSADGEERGRRRIVGDGGCDVVAFDAHFERAEGDLVEVFFNVAEDGGCLVEALDVYLPARGERRDGVVCAGSFAGRAGWRAERGDGRAELAFKLGAEAFDAALRVFGELELHGFIVDGGDGLTHLGFKVADEGSEFEFESAGAVFEIGVAFAGKPGALLVEGVLLGSGGFAVLFERE